VSYEDEAIEALEVVKEEWERPYFLMASAVVYSMLAVVSAAKKVADEVKALRREAAKRK
jgi:hypothetical protein